MYLSHCRKITFTILHLQVNYNLKEPTNSTTPKFYCETVESWFTFMMSLKCSIVKLDVL